jgi:hypothetical protein
MIGYHHGCLPFWVILIIVATFSKPQQRYHVYKAGGAYEPLYHTLGN